MLMTELFGVRIVEQHRFYFLMITHNDLRLIIYQHYRRLLIKSDKDQETPTDKKFTLSKVASLLFRSS